MVRWSSLVALVVLATFASPSTAGNPASGPLVVALEHLKKARAALESAPEDATGDRAQALAAIDRAIVSVERASGMAPPVKPGTKGLEASAITSTAASQRAVLQKICFKPYSAKGSTTVKLDLRIGASGIVNDAVLLEQTGGDPRVGRCVLGQAWWWKFPAAGGDSQAVVPFVFSQ